MEIVSAWGRPTNPHYDPSRSSDGGGYWQFEGGCLFEIEGRMVTVEVEDSSCGEFGSRMDAQITDPEHKWYFVWGSMDDVEGFYPDEEVIRSASGCIGIADAGILIDMAMEAADMIARGW